VPSGVSDATSPPSHTSSSWIQVKLYLYFYIIQVPSDRFQMVFLQELRVTFFCPLRRTFCLQDQSHWFVYYLKKYITMSALALILFSLFSGEYTITAPGI